MKHNIRKSLQAVISIGILFSLSCCRQEDPNGGKTPFYPIPKEIKDYCFFNQLKRIRQMEKDQTQTLIPGFVHSEKSPLNTDKLKQFKGLEHLSDEEAETVLYSLNVLFLSW